MRRPLRLYAPACLAVLSAFLLTGCHQPKAWAPVPNTPAIDPKDDFTLTWDSTKQDANGLPLNPYWGLEKTKQELPPRKQGDHPYPCEPDPYSSQCTENKNLVKDGPEFPNWVICKVGNLGADFNGHADWVVGSEQGCVKWEDESFDGDYNFQLFPPDPLHSVLTKNNDEFIGLEFDSGETIANVQSKFWLDLREEVGRENNDTQPHQAQIAAILNPKHPDRNPRAAVAGLVGLDCEHGCKSEVHPVFAFAIETNPDPDDNTWELFVRNWGDEGYCSHFRHLVDFPNNQVSVLLFDDPTSQGMEVIPGSAQMFVTEGVQVAFPTVSYWGGRGPVITFTMPPPEQAALVELEIHLKWSKLAGTSCGGAARTMEATPLHPAQPQSAEEFLRKAKKEGPGGAPRVTALAAAKPAPKMVAIQTPQEIRVEAFTPPTKPAAPVRRAVLSTDTAQAARNIEDIRQLCSDYKNHLPLFQGQDLSAQLCDETALRKAAQKSK